MNVQLLAEAWANVMDGRRIGTGLDAARIGRDTTTPEDWRAILAEYNILADTDAPPQAHDPALDPVREFLDKYGLANTSGPKHEARKAALARARAVLDG